MAEGVRVIWDGAKLAELLRSPTGPVGRHLIERAEVVRQAAKSKAPRRTGCLQDSVVKRFELDDLTGFRIRIVCDTTPCSPTRTSYAYFVHEGTRLHVIEGNPLAFTWHGEQVFFTRVSHPVYRGNPFLRDALPLAAA
jgi:hypothetical protein